MLYSACGCACWSKSTIYLRGGDTLQIYLFIYSTFSRITPYCPTAGVLRGAGMRSETKTTKPTPVPPCHFQLTCSDCCGCCNPRVWPPLLSWPPPPYPCVPAPAVLHTMRPQDTSGGSSRAARLLVDFVAVCTGLHTSPHLPKLEVWLWP